MRRGLAALAVLFLAAHLPFLPPTLEDVDSVNFALGVRDFDVARHQPHPPGYPVFTALAKGSTAALRAADVPVAAVRGLTIWSALAGAVLVPLLFLLFRALDGDPWRAWWAAGITAASPLFWFTALRPLSDMLGLAFAVAAQALLVRALLQHGGGEPARALRLGAFLAGAAVGVRSQTAVLTLPLLATALIVMPWRWATLRDRALALAAAATGVMLWAVPLLVASGGPEAYLAALAGQAGEDFAGTPMLWTTRNARAAADALTYSFLWPWGGLMAGGIVIALALAGGIRLAWTDPRVFAVLAVAFGPYAVFHLLFHETATVRYALPLLPAVAYLSVQALQSMGRAAASVGGIALVAASLAMAMPAARAYGVEGSPTFKLLEDLAGLSDDGRLSQPVPKVIGMHAVMHRAQEWMGLGDSRVLRAPHGGEWLSLVDHWRQSPASSAFFIADPRRTDLALFDPQARELIQPYRWSLPPVPYVGGARPGEADLYAMRPPGWMLGQGWALTAEVAGVSARDGAGPHVQPAVAWVRGRSTPALLAIGGRNLGQATDPTARLTIAGDTGVLDSWTVPPGFFFHVVSLPAGSLAGSGYVPLRVRAAGAQDPARRVPVAIEQFDLQPEGQLMSGFEAGWHEQEFNPVTSRAWRWMSERSVFWVRPVGRDVTLMLAGESPLRYFDRAPTVRVSVGAREVIRFSAAADFMVSAELPAGLLSDADGRVVLESDRWFSPADRGEADRRRLALRVYSIAVR